MTPMPTPDVSAQDQAHPEADMVQPAPTEELPADAAAPPDCPCDAPSNVEVEAQVEANADGQGSDAHAQSKSIPVTPPFGGQVEPEPEAAGSATIPGAGVVEEAAGSATIPGARGVEDSTESFEDSQEQRVYSALVAIVDGRRRLPTQSQLRARTWMSRPATRTLLRKRTTLTLLTWILRWMSRTRLRQTATRTLLRKRSTLTLLTWILGWMSRTRLRQTATRTDAPAQEDNADMDVEADMDGIEPPAKHSSFLQPHAKAQFVSAVLA